MKQPYSQAVKQLGTGQLGIVPQSGRETAMQAQSFQPGSQAVKQPSTAYLTVSCQTDTRPNCEAVWQ